VVPKENPVLPGANFVSGAEVPGAKADFEAPIVNLDPGVADDFIAPNENVDGNVAVEIVDFDSVFS
jgi:hypothetical protein